MEEHYINWVAKSTEKKIQLKDKDLKLIKLIRFNSRIPLTKLAKQLKISKVAVFNKIKNLKSKGIITGYSCFINFSKLNLKFYQIAIKTLMTIKQKQEYLDRINNLDFVNSILKLAGSKWSFLVRIISTEKQLNKHLNAISDPSVSGLDIMQVHSMVFFDDESEKVSFTDMIPEDNRLSKYEIRLLYELAKNSRHKIVDLSLRLKKSPKTIMQTMKKLKKKGVIVSFPVQFNPFIYGNEGFILTVMTKDRRAENNITNGLIKFKSQGALLNFQNPNIISFHIVSSLEDLKKIENILQPYADEILDYEFIKIEEQSKYHFFPKDAYNFLLNQKPAKE